MNAWHGIGRLDEFVEDEPRGIQIQGVPIAVFRVGAEIFALHDLCTHQTALLSEGFVEDGCVECPLHQGWFDLRTGEARKAPCVTPVQVYPVRIMADERVEVQLLPQTVAS